MKLTMQTQDWSKLGYRAIGREIYEKIKNFEHDEVVLASVAAQVLDLLSTRESDGTKRASALSQINSELLKRYPRLEREEENYWYDEKGRKEETKRWRHNIFKYLTLGRTSDKPQTSTEAVPSENEVPSMTVTVAEPRASGLNIELDSEAQALVNKALEISGLDFQAFVKQAVIDRAKTIVNRFESGIAIETVSTRDLLTNPSWKTHPRRIEELTKRAIRAIQIFNTEKAISNADRWAITQSAIASLTGSRPSAIGEVLSKYRDQIESHNQGYGLGTYANRKPGKSIDKEISLLDLVPDGLA